MRYLGELIFYYISLVAMVIAWFASDAIPNPFSIFIDEPWLRMLTLAGVAVAGVILRAIFRGVLGAFGILVAIGAGVGAVASLLYGISEAVSYADPEGFFAWVGLFFGCAILVSVTAAITGAGLRGVFSGIFRLDFVSCLIYAMIAWTGFLGLGETLMGIMDCSVGLFIFVLICGIPSGITGAASDNGGFLDENGQLHFASHSMGRNRVMTTDGKVFRKMPGGWTDRHM